MSIAALSSAGFSQDVADSGNLTAADQALSALDRSLAEGNLTQVLDTAHRVDSPSSATPSGNIVASETQLAPTVDLYA